MRNFINDQVSHLKLLREFGECMNSIKPSDFVTLLLKIHLV